MKMETQSDGMSLVLTKEYATGITGTPIELCLTKSSY